MKTYSITKKTISHLAETPGVYIFRNPSGAPVYIGKAKNIKSRVKSYFTLKLLGKTKLMMRQAKYISVIRVAYEFEAILLEAKLVRKYLPRYNYQLRDDKSPLYIGVTQDSYPRILILRKNQLAKLNLGNLFGPFEKSSEVKIMLKLIRRISPFCQHKPAFRPCLESQIGLCNPCSSAIEITKNLKLKRKLMLNYKRNVRMTTAILSGKIYQLEKILLKKMNSYSKLKLFEKAITLRGQIETIRSLYYSFETPQAYLKDPNLAEDIRKAELSDLKKTIAKYLKIGYPRRIECFDIAHFAGSNPTASMVTFINGERETKYYRHFRITNQKKSDDTGMIKNVIERRIKHLKDWGKPDLVVVDGGKGQVTAAISVIGHHFPVVGLAKRYENLIIKNETGFVEISLFTDPALRLLQRMRNEAHRFARNYHHKLVATAMKSI